MPVRWGLGPVFVYESMLAARGTYRWVLLLALVPLYAAVFVAATAPDVPPFAVGWRSPRPTPVPLTVPDRVCAATICIADFLASGAVLVGVGLALATWIRRPGRAATVSVIAFFLVGIGWPFLVEMFGWWMVTRLSYHGANWHRSVQPTLVSLSPIAGPMDALQRVMRLALEPRTVLWWCFAGAVLFKLSVASLLYALTVRTFDRCVGRVSASRGRSPSSALRG